MRLIDADILKQQDFQDFSNTDVFNAIDSCPTVDLKELRPKCTWEQIYEDTWECSNCGACWTCIDGDPTDNDMHFCPVCGAEIEGVVE